MLLHVLRRNPFLAIRCLLLPAVAFCGFMSSCTNVYVVREAVAPLSRSLGPKAPESVHVLLAPQARAADLRIGAGFFSDNRVRAAAAFGDSLVGEFSAFFSSASAIESERVLGADDLAVTPAAWLHWSGVFFPSGTLLVELRLRNFMPGREIVLVSSAAYRPSGSWFMPLFIPLCDPLIPSCNLYERRMTSISGLALEKALARAVAGMSDAVRLIAEWRASYDEIGRLMGEGRPREALARAESAIARFGFDPDLGREAALAAESSRRLSLAAKLADRASKLARLEKKARSLAVRTPFGFSGAPNLGYLEDVRETRVLAVTGVLRLRGARLTPAWCLKNRCWAARVSELREGSPAWLLGLSPGDELLGSMERKLPDFALRFFLAAYPGEIVPIVTAAW